MKILFVPSDNNVYHGAFLSMAKLASILQEQYAHTVLVVLPCEGNGKEMLDRFGIRNLIVPSYNWVYPIALRNNLAAQAKQVAKRVLNLKAIQQIAEIIQTEHIDLVHINTTWTYVGAAAALRCGTPFVWHIREFLEDGQKLCIWNRRAALRLISKADQVIAISNSLKDKYSKLIDPDKIRLVSNGVDPQRFLSSEHQPFQNQFLRFLLVGTLEEWKGQADAIRACIKLIEEDHLKFELILAGNSNTAYAKPLKELVKDRGVEEYIRFIGETSTPEDLYKQADITFMCSTYEAFGRVTVEAMFAGSLVIGSKSAGTLDIVRDGETGFLYTPGNISELREKVLYAVKHPKESCVIAKQGQAEALTRFTAKENARAVNAVYLDVIQK